MKPGASQSNPGRPESPPASADFRTRLIEGSPDCIKVLDLWDERSASHGISLVGLFDEVLEFWAFMPLNLDEEILRVADVVLQ